MTFTYQGTLEAAIDRVRFALDDTVQDAGPLPGSANFSDEEIAGLVSLEGSWTLAVAAGFERLAAAWARHVSFTADETQVAQSDIAKRYEAQATTWRARGAVASRTAGTRAVTRQDGYSTDQAAV